ncbi:MAG TPA: stage II sporulation protein M [Burkholderiales bacterium]|nr:stage II sporulation protein M [Burkholderiales bacterium]
MRQTAFETRYGAEILRFERWLDERGKPRRRRSPAGPSDALADQDLPAAYRRICQLLALARDRQYSPDLVDRLNQLVLRGHHLLYGASGGRPARLLSFLAADFPRLVREEWRLLAAAALLFFGPLLALIAALQLHPDFIYYLVEPRQLAGFQEMYDPANPRLGMRQADSNVMMFAFYIWNNVKIGFQTFATGLAFGLGTVFYLVFNGLTIGAVAGYLTAIGYGKTFWSFVSGHSAFELTAIVLSGVAGLKLGGAVIAPGARSRKAALVEAAKPAVRIMYGAALLFLGAAFIEGFWSPLTIFPATTKYAVGGILWAAVAAYFAIGGRGRGA